MALSLLQTDSLPLPVRLSNATPAMSSARPSAPDAAAAPSDHRPCGNGHAAAHQCDEQKQGAAHVSPVTRLYRHAIESVFGFLNLRELSRVLCVSWSWAAAVRSMKSIGATVPWKRDLPKRIAAASSLASHVKHFGTQGYPTQTSCSDLLLLSRPPISLISLACAVDLSPPTSRLFLGASLRTVALSLTDEANTTSVVNDAIVTVSRLPFLEKLDLRLPLFFPEVSFASLAVAPQLREFRCGALDCGQPTHPQIDQLRMFTHLRKMEVGLSRDSLLYLLRTPHSLQWQQIQRVDDFDDELAAALSTLPALTRLNTNNCRSVAFLPSFSRLRGLELYMDPTVRIIAEIGAGLACCSQLTELSLMADGLTSQHLSYAMPHLPTLRSLEIMYSAVNSLSFLSECSHLAHSLQSLQVRGSYPPVAPSTELKHILTLKNLTHLFLDGFFVEPLDAPTVDALTPPSDLLAKLERFRYTR